MNLLDLINSLSVDLSTLSKSSIPSKTSTTSIKDINNNIQLIKHKTIKLYALTLWVKKNYDFYCLNNISTYIVQNKEAKISEICNSLRELPLYLSSLIEPQYDIRTALNNYYNNTQKPLEIEVISYLRKKGFIKEEHLDVDSYISAYKEGLKVIDSQNNNNRYYLSLVNKSEIDNKCSLKFGRRNIFEIVFFILKESIEIKELDIEGTDGDSSIINELNKIFKDKEKIMGEYAEMGLKPNGGIIDWVFLIGLLEKIIFQVKKGYVNTSSLSVDKTKIIINFANFESSEGSYSVIKQEENNSITKLTNIYFSISGLKVFLEYKFNPLTLSLYTYTFKDPILSMFNLSNDQFVLGSNDSQLFEEFLSNTDISPNKLITLKERFISMIEETLSSYINLSIKIKNNIILYSNPFFGREYNPIQIIEGKFKESFDLFTSINTMNSFTLNNNLKIYFFDFDNFNVFNVYFYNGLFKVKLFIKKNKIEYFVGVEGNNEKILSKIINSPYTEELNEAIIYFHQWFLTTGENVCEIDNDKEKKYYFSFPNLKNNFYILKNKSEILAKVNIYLIEEENENFAILLSQKELAKLIIKKTFNILKEKINNLIILFSEFLHIEKELEIFPGTLQMYKESLIVKSENEMIPLFAIKIILYVCDGPEIFYFSNGHIWSHNLSLIVDGSIISNVSDFFNLKYFYNQTITELDNSNNINTYCSYISKTKILQSPSTKTISIHSFPSSNYKINNDINNEKYFLIFYLNYPLVILKKQNNIFYSSQIANSKTPYSLSRITNNSNNSHNNFHKFHNFNIKKSEIISLKFEEISLDKIIDLIESSYILLLKRYLYISHCSNNISSNADNLMLKFNGALCYHSESSLVVSWLSKLNNLKNKFQTSEKYIYMFFDSLISGFPIVYLKILSLEQEEKINSENKKIIIHNIRRNEEGNIILKLEINNSYFDRKIEFGLCYYVLDGKLVLEDVTEGYQKNVVLVLDRLNDKFKEGKVISRSENRVEELKKNDILYQMVKRLCAVNFFKGV